MPEKKNRDPRASTTIRTYLAYLRIVMLEAEGYEFCRRRERRGGPAGLQAGAAGRFVIVDLMMEEVDAGVRFTRELQIRRSEVPIFMLSSVGDNFNLTADYSALGLAGIFQKPITKDTLLSVLEATLSPASA